MPDDGCDKTRHHSSLVVKEENLPPQRWNMARVLKVHLNPNDNKELVTTVSIKTSDGVYRRPIAKLILLPMGEDEAKPEHPPSPTDTGNYS
ncbi:unnamed protein product [Allacma fusca]|uniref:DUF5641 domain-containing protein n=1 Tax=Allacma fusca TaxID=39272 RepID=A0A8J2L4Q4_9HEXA|nr:unnamed protein product [Allacma fusca]